MIPGLTSRLELIRGLILALTLGLILGLSVVGCATVPMASAEEDDRIRRLVPPEDAGLVYLYRNETIGYSVHMDVRRDGSRDGSTVAESYMVWQLPPGTHTFVSEAENNSEIDVDVEAGRRYFVWQEVKMGVWYARSQLHLVSDAEGRAGLRECKLIRMRLPPGPRRAPVPPTPLPVQQQQPQRQNSAQPVVPTS